MHSVVGLAGKALYEQRRIPEAMACFQKALALGEDDRTHAFERWACWMLLGKYECAWKEADRSAPPWQGDIRRPRHVLIRCLRGLGDAIQFLRYVPLLSSRCARVTVHAPDSLHPLIAAVPGVGAVNSRDQPADGLMHDCEIECSHLPYALRTTIETLPDPIRVPETDAPPGCLRAIREASVGTVRTGIVWSAGDWNPARSIPLELLMAHLPATGITLISLQRACGRKPESVSVPAKIINAETGPANPLATAAIIAELDLVVTVDTMVAHLAGSMGKPVWTILPYAADWRWMLGRTSPWYPSMRLFRQASPGDWAAVLQEVGSELEEFSQAAYLRTMRAQNSA